MDNGGRFRLTGLTVGNYNHLIATTSRQRDPTDDEKRINDIVSDDVFHYAWFRDYHPTPRILC